MKRILFDALLVTATALSSGCATIYTTVVPGDTPVPYAGVRLDANITASIVTAGRVPCRINHCQERLWLLAGAVSDFPLSFLADTVALPYTLVRSSQ